MWCNLGYTKVSTHSFSSNFSQFFSSTIHTDLLEGERERQLSLRMTSHLYITIAKRVFVLLKCRLGITEDTHTSYRTPPGKDLLYCEERAREGGRPVGTLIPHKQLRCNRRT